MAVLYHIAFDEVTLTLDHFRLALAGVLATAWLVQLLTRREE